MRNSVEYINAKSVENINAKSVEYINTKSGEYKYKNCVRELKFPDATKPKPVSPNGLRG
jgi:hypothetical protein